MAGLRCAVCGGEDFVDAAVLWDGLVAEWQISPEERAYVDRQQGTHCRACGANLRSSVLAQAILAALGHPGPLAAAVGAAAHARLRVLEINPAGNLTGTISRLPGHRLVSWPEVDMHAMPFADGSFDLVVHSDTLEHVAHPVRALAECRRVLAPGGWLCYTVPVIVGRLTRNRAGLPPSYHGNSGVSDADWQVQTEYGADMWTEVIRAGFSTVAIHALDWPSALALRAQR
jgi:SAM-dependent methyltransferase